MKGLRSFVGVAAIVWLAVLLFGSANAQNRYLAHTGPLVSFDPSYQGGGIYRFAPDGTRTTFATNLARPLGLAFDSAGNLFVADTIRDAIYKFAPNGARSTFVANIDRASGLAFDRNGMLFMSDTRTAIYRFTPSGTFTTFTSGLLAADAIAFNAAGDLFVADTGTNFNDARLYRFTTNAVRQTVATGLTASLGLAFNRAGDLFYSDHFTGNIYRFSSNGVRRTFASGLNRPSGLVINSADEIFVAEIGRISKFRTNGVRSTFGVVSTNATHMVFAPDPPLEIASVSNQVILKWPASATNYALQTATNLVSPTWVSVTNVASDAGLMTTSSAAFFRLQRR